MARKCLFVGGELHGVIFLVDRDPPPLHWRHLTGSNGDGIRQERLYIRESWSRGNVVQNTFQIAVVYRLQGYGRHTEEETDLLEQHEEVWYGRHAPGQQP